MLEAILPISDHQKVRRNVDRTEMLLRSLNYFWKDEQNLKIHIVIPDDQIVDLRSRIKDFGLMPKLNLIFHRDSEISPALAGRSDAFGIAKQMIIKLAAFGIVMTDFYLTLDSDLVACKPFGADEIIFDGLALTDWRIPLSHNWYRESAKILAVAIDSDYLLKPRLFVTPQVLSSHLSRRLSERLVAIFKGDWADGLLDRYTGNHPDIWTEYTLYDLFGSSEDLLGRFHLVPEAIPANRRLQSVEDGIWYAQQFEAWHPGRALAATTPGLFLVLQSITAGNLDFDLVKSRWYNEVALVHPALADRCAM